MLDDLRVVTVDDPPLRPIRYFQLTDYGGEGQLFQVEFRDDLFEMHVQNEQGKPVVLTLTQREGVSIAAREER